MIKPRSYQRVVIDDRHPDGAAHHGLRGSATIEFSVLKAVVEPPASQPDPLSHADNAGHLPGCNG
jgi:hypothetical protein